MRGLLAGLLLVLVLAGCAQVPKTLPKPLPAPPLLSVDTWGGSASSAPAQPQRIERITLHHQGETWAPEADPAAYLRRLQQWSRLSKRWADIPYHYVIAPDGRIYSARPQSIAGDTNTAYDPRGHALVMLLGNFEHQTPTPAALESSIALLAWLAQQHRIAPDGIASHRDFSQQTVCPGAQLYARLPALREAVAARLAAGVR